MSTTVPLMRSSPSAAKSRDISWFLMARLEAFQKRSESSALQPVELGISLVFPIANFFQNVGDFHFGQVFRLLVADFGRNVQPQGRAVFASERLVVHFVAEQCLR